MGKTTKYIYAVGLYQVGSQIYQAANSWYNIYEDKKPLKDRLSIYRDGDEGTQWAIVTGASEGIGAAYALQLAQCGYNIRLVARSDDKMAKVCEEARKLNPKIQAEYVPLDVSKASPQDYAALFNERERTSIVVNNAGIMKNQNLLQTDPALLEAMIKTNVHPYVYLTKYALQHFSQNAASHQHKTALLYTSSTAAQVDFPLMSSYSGTKTHNVVFANLIRKYASKSLTFTDMLRVQTLHPATVTSNLNNFRTGKTAPDAVMPDECARGSLCDLNSQQLTFGAFKHSVIGLFFLPFFKTFGPLLKNQFKKEFENDREVILEPFVDPK